MSKNFKEKYGRVALIAGASEGLGAAFARELALRGMDLILIARRKEKLETLAAELTEKFVVDVKIICCDLSEPESVNRIFIECADRPIHFLIYNAALSFIGPFLEQELEGHLRITELNMVTPLKMVHHFGKQMLADQRGGIILMSSLAGSQGSGFLATYAATKAFNRILAESIWYEWKNKNVDIMACRAGAIDTPNYTNSQPKKTNPFAPKPQSPEAVVEACLSKIGTTPSFVSGASNKIASFIMNRIFSVKRSINLMGDTTRKMYEVKD